MKPNDSLLRESLHIWADKFYEWIKKEGLANDDVEFGAWDHTFLSQMIAFWIHECASSEKSGCNATFWEKGFMDVVDTDVYDQAFIAAKQQQLKVYNQLVVGFKEMACGVEDNFDKTMRNFKKYYRTMWD